MKEILQTICCKHGFTYKSYATDLFDNFSAVITRKDRKGFKVHIEISELLTITEIELEKKIFERFNLRRQ
jgi:hypothetical protein